ncbi:hypothetical protein SSX86_024843 [Deinandra increscens subsp. villosa]|uniref:Uncharacterized protein n=1 Tax=Deinandra increscens subsp. villosa TaxID=3103831 RepID=A0AAP0CIB2_9ASTR
MISMIFSLSSCQSPVLDTDQLPLVTGPAYYILTVGRGGVNLSPATNNQTCPLDVSLEHNVLRNGLPLNFLLAIPNRGGVIRSSSDLNIKFSNTTTCGRPAVWQLVERCQWATGCFEPGDPREPGRGNDKQLVQDREV